MSILVHESAINPDSSLWAKSDANGRIVVLQNTAQVTMNQIAPNTFTFGTYTLPRLRGIYEVEVTWAFQNVSANTNQYTAILQETSTNAQFPTQTTPNSSGAGVVAYLSQGVQLNIPTDGATALTFTVRGTCTNVSGSQFPLGSAVVKITYFPT